MLFDNFGVLDITGPVLEETHYYPFGLTMEGISTTAPLKLANGFKFQSQELQRKEFSDGSGLETYQFKYRMDDPQTGRFWQIDPLADKYVYNSPYAFSENKVTSYIELEGLESVYMDYRTERDLKDIESGKINAEQLNERLDVRAKSDILALGVGLIVDAAVEEFGWGSVFKVIKSIFTSKSNKEALKKIDNKPTTNNQGTGLGRGKNNRTPDPEAEGDHTVSNDRGSTTYQKNDKNPSGFQEAKRVDTKGGSHNGVETPHVHENGKVRPANEDEIPKTDLSKNKKQ